MPTIRPKIVVDNEYVSQTSYTIELDLPTSGIVSTFWLIVRARTGTTYPVGMPFLKYLIQSVSINQAGQEALNAARPCAFQADYYYKTGKFPNIGMRLWQTVGDIEETIPILFGDKIDDPEHYIDLSKLNDPKLSVTYDLATTDYLDQTIWDTDVYPRFTVIADFLEGAGVGTNKGYHSLRTIESFTPSDLQKKKVELKGARPIKRIYLWQDATNPGMVMHQNVQTIKLTGDNDAWVPFSMEAERYKDFIRLLYGTCTATGQMEYPPSSKEQDIIVEELEHGSVRGNTNVDHYPELYGGSGRSRGFWFYERDGGGQVAGQTGRIWFSFTGIAPWSIYPIDMPKMLGMEYLDPTEHAPVYVEIDFEDSLTEAYSAPFRVVIEDLVKV